MLADANFPSASVCGEGPEGPRQVSFPLSKSFISELDWVALLVEDPPSMEVFLTLDSRGQSFSRFYSVKETMDFLRLSTALHICQNIYLKKNNGHFSAAKRCC